MSQANDFKDVYFAAIAASQHVMQRERPDLIVDGYWGTFTNNAYVNASAPLKSEVNVLLKTIASVTASQLFARSRVAKTKSNSPAHSEIMDARVRRGTSAAAGAVEAIVAAATRAGITGRSLANLLANISVESNFRLVREDHMYGVVQARKTYSAAKRYTDAQLEALKAKGREAWFEAMMGPGGSGLAGPNPGDGGKFYGRGYIQLTGRRNYTAFDAAFPQYKALENPDVLITNQQAAADAAVWFWKQNVVSKGKDVDIRKSAVAVNGPAAKGLSERVAASSRYMAQYA